MDYFKNLAQDNLKKTNPSQPLSSKQYYVPEFNTNELFNNNQYKKFSIGPYYSKGVVEDIKEHQDIILNRISDRLMKATSLYVKSSGGGELYRIANYGPGGYYIHHDPFLWHNPKNMKREEINADSLLMGDRLATVIGYISDIHLGGATCFPNLGIKVMVRRTLKEGFITCFPSF